MFRDRFTMRGGALISSKAELPDSFHPFDVFVRGNRGEHRIPWPLVRLTVQRECIDVSAPFFFTRFHKELITDVQVGKYLGRKHVLFIRQKRGVTWKRMYFWPTMRGVFRRASRWRMMAIHSELQSLGYI